jgi:hypothetical protein
MEVHHELLLQRPPQRAARVPRNVLGLDLRLSGVIQRQLGHVAPRVPHAAEDVGQDRLTPARDPSSEVPPVAVVEPGGFQQVRVCP